MAERTINEASFFADGFGGGDDAEGSYAEALDAALDAEPDEGDDDETDEAEDADAPEAEAADSEDEASPDEPPAAAEEPSEPELPESVKAELEALREERAQLRRIQAEQAARESEQYWADQWNGLVGSYHQQIEKIEQDAKRVFGGAQAEEQFRVNAHRRLAQWWTEQTQQYQGAREQALYEHQARQRVPHWAEQVARDFGLTPEDVPTLLGAYERTGDPNAMPVLAEELRTLRRSQRQHEAGKRAAAAVAPGSGQAAPRRKPRSLSDYYDQQMAQTA